jgi:hypothetical protein
MTLKTTSFARLVLALILLGTTCLSASASHPTNRQSENSPTCGLAMAVIPDVPRTTTAGSSILYICTVVDLTGAPATGATVVIHNPAMSQTSNVPVINGTASYSASFASGGIFTLTFKATKPGCTPSEVITRQATVPKLFVEVTPATAQSVLLSGSINYSITVKDQSGAPVSGANVSIGDPFLGGYANAQSSNGSVSYTTNCTSPGAKLINFSATKTGYVPSWPPVGRTINVAPPCVLSLAVTPTATQTIPFGGSTTYSISVKNQSGVLQTSGSTTLLVTNPFNSTQQSTIATVNGIATYTVTGSSAGTKTISFMAQSTNTGCTGTGSASTVSRQLTVNPSTLDRTR